MAFRRPLDWSLFDDNAVFNSNIFITHNYHFFGG